jgi:hypothetical protein
LEYVIRSFSSSISGKIQKTHSEVVIQGKICFSKNAFRSFHSREKMKISGREGSHGGGEIFFEQFIG